VREQGLRAESFAIMFREFYVRLHGVPDTIVSDQDPRFMGKVWKALMDSLQVHLGKSSPYHPQTDGQTEKVNHIIGTYLRAFARHEPDKWDSLLPLGEFAYNPSMHVATGKTPFKSDIGYTPKVAVDLAQRVIAHLTAARARNGLSFGKTMEANIRLARDCLALAQDK
jgi:hypothetical protein